MDTESIVKKLDEYFNELRKIFYESKDSCDITVANGLPCAFEEYEVYQNGEWSTIENGIPTSRDRIRFSK